MDCAKSHSGDPSIDINGRIESMAPQESIDSYPGIDTGFSGVPISPLVQNWHGWDCTALSCLKHTIVIRKRVDREIISNAALFLVSCAALLLGDVGYM